MKTNKVLLMLLAGTLLCAGCGGQPTPTSSQTSGSSSASSGSSGTTSKAESQWSAALQADMMEVLGEILPNLKVDMATLDAGIDTDDDGDYIYLEDSSTVDYVNENLAILEGEGWEEVYEEDGCHWLDKGNLEIQVVYATATELYSAGNCMYAYSLGGEEEEWYTEYVEMGYEHVFSFNSADVKTNLGLTIDVVAPTIDPVNGLCTIYDEENNLYSAAIYGDVTNSYASSLRTAGYDIVEVAETTYDIDWENLEIITIEYTQYYAYDSTHELAVVFSSEYGDITDMSFVLFDEYFVENKTADTSWNFEDDYLDFMLSDLPFVQLGDDYDLVDEYYEEEGCYLVCDSYYHDLLGDYGDALEAAGWAYDEDEKSVTFGKYTKTIGDIDVTLYFYWDVGNVIVISFETPTLDGTFDLGVTTQVDVNTADKVTFVSGAYTFTINKGSSTSDANNYLGDGTPAHTRVYKGMTIGFSWTGEAPSTIAITCTDSNYAPALAACPITGGRMTVSGDTVTIAVDSAATEVSIDLATCTQKHVRLTKIVVE